MEKELINNSQSNIYPFHMPGHKRRGSDIGAGLDPYAIDITEIDNFDNLHHAEGIIKEAQAEAAALYGAKRAYFLINGSTCGILAAVSAATKRGDKVLVARNCHKAVYHALYLRQLHPVFIYPEITRTGLQGQITEAQIRAAFDENPDIKAVVITSPTYDGVVSDVAAIASVVHAHGALLIVDEAHGAHFGFGSGFPQNAIALGADAVIVSLHKTLPAFTQTALLLLGGMREAAVEKFLGIYETSSPSYVLMTGIERCIHYVRDNKETAFAQLRSRLDRFYQKVSGLSHLSVVRKSDFSADEAYDFDESKIIIFTKEAMNGHTLLELLLKKYELQLEMAAGNYVLALASVMDTDEGFDRLADALIEIDSQLEKYKSDFEEFYDILKQEDVVHQFYFPVKMDTTIYQKLPAVMEMYDAYDAEHQAVYAFKASGKVSGAFINIYPPGIPLVVPGEIMNDKLIDDVIKAVNSGLEVDGLYFDPDANMWKFVAVL